MTLTIEEQEISLAEEDLLIETVRKEGFVAESDKGVTVVLDTNLTPELVEEGFVREAVNKLQTTRKEAGLAVTDRIVVGFKTDAELARILHAYADSIMSDVLAVSMQEGELDGFVKEWSINGIPAVFSVKKV